MRRGFGPLGPLVLVLQGWMLAALNIVYNIVFNIIIALKVWLPVCWLCRAGHLFSSNREKYGRKAAQAGHRTDIEIGSGAGSAGP
jgi:hypothetical protein